MRCLRQRLLPLAAGLLVVLAAAAPASAGALRGPHAAPVAPALPGISADGPQLEQNGLPWVARGVQIVGLVAPNASLAGKYIAAHAHFGAAELEQAVADHANVVRFQVSEFGLNPADPLYDPSYAAEVQSGVETARALGLDVIVSLQAETPAGNETRCPLPDAGAATDWLELAQMFSSDRDIMFELYNEPGLPASAANWAAWAAGGVLQSGVGPCTAVGMQSLVDEIRGAGADNVIILPGLAGEQTLAGVPKITDPAYPSDPQLAYGIHYPNLTQTSTAWDAEFGSVAQRRPVIVTEWQANGTTNCVADSPRVAPLLLSYLALKQIGVVGFAFDLPGTIVADYDYDPTSYANFACGSFTGGAGQVLFADYAGEAAQETAVPGSGAPASWLVDGRQLSQMVALDPATTVLALDTPRTFVLGTDSAELDGIGMGAASPAQSFPSETALAQAVASGTLPAGTEAVELALGPHSPLAEQRHPQLAFTLAAAAAHRGGYLLLAAPQIGLVHTLEPHSRPRDRNVVFIRRNLAAAAAKRADAVVLPFGAAAAQTDGYAAITQIAAAQANAAQPGVQVIDSLSVGGAHPPTGPALAQAARATSGLVTGYSMSGQPSPTSPSPVGLLQTLYGAG